MTREDDLYRALGLERTASQEEIRKAYKTTGAFYSRKKFSSLSCVFCTQKERCLSSCEKKARAKTRSRFYFRAQRRALLTRERFIFSLFLHHHSLNRSFEKPPG
jgi:hypothetical protein